MPNLHLQSYTTFAKRRGLTIEQVSEYLDSEEGCLWMRSDKTYVILYNDTVKNKSRIRFTLAHELGHYVLQHNEIGNQTRLMRYSLSDREYDVFEKEANYFAKRLLAPIPLIDAIMSQTDSIDIYQLEEIFKISFSVANYLLKELKQRNRITNISREIHELVSNFKHELELLNVKKCNVCESEINSKYNHCPFCGMSDFLGVMDYGFKDYKKERNQTMIYSGIETNSNGTPIECPRCHAENLKDDYMFCPWCSVILHNFCLGTEENQYRQIDAFGNTEKKTISEQIQDGCGKLLDGSFRYCPDCGGETTYHRQKLLSDWLTEYEEDYLPF